MNTDTTPQATRIARYISTSRNPKSAWDKGVLAYALDLLDGYEPEQVTERGLLNGASDWSEYSYGGSSFIYDEDIAEALATPSELKLKRGGELQPSSRETWLDVQARALYQASRLILRAAKAIA